jgi:hypothetical protein
MWPAFIVIALPTGDLSPCIPQIEEPVRIQTLIAKTAIETLNVTILGGLPGRNVPQQYTMFLAPGVY